MYCREIGVVESNSRASGSCNGCTEYSSAKGTDLHTVYNIDLRNTNVRVCPKCAKELLRLLKEAIGA